MKKCLAIILALVMAFGCMSVAAFAAGSPDLSKLKTGAKIQLGTYPNDVVYYDRANNRNIDIASAGEPVEWVIGGDGTTGMSVPTGCIALVSSGIVAGGILFDLNETSNVYASSNLRGVVENAVTFSTDEQAVIQSRTLAGNQTYGETCDGVAGDAVTATVWAPTTKDAYGLNEAGLSKVGKNYWLCSPGSAQTIASCVKSGGTISEFVVYGDNSVRAALYIDLSKVTNVTLVKGTTDTYILNAPSTFLTSFTLNKDYNDKYSTGNKTTAVNETVTYTIAPISTGDDVPEFENDTFTITVTGGVGSAEVPLPETITKAGDYWYSITETGGKTAGVTYDTNTYYLHLITDCKGDEFGVLTAQIHVTAPDLTKTDYADQFVNEASDKIDTVSNSYGEGSLVITQDTKIDGEDNDYDEFEATVTFTLPAGTEITGDITYGDNQTVTFDDNGVGTAVITLKGGESITFEHIPDGVTYTVEQTNSNEDLGFELDSIAFDSADTGDKVENNIASGTIGDAEDVLTISNVMETATDVGVIVEYTAFVLLALAAAAAGAWLVISRRRKAIDAE